MAVCQMRGSVGASSWSHLCSLLWSLAAAARCKTSMDRRSPTWPETRPREWTQDILSTFHNKSQMKILNIILYKRLLGSKVEGGEHKHWMVVSWILLREFFSLLALEECEMAKWWPGYDCKIALVVWRNGYEGQNLSVWGESPVKKYQYCPK